MNCPSCAFANSPEARFCGSCGSRLSVTCPNCGADLVGELRFCTACGEPVTSASARLSPSPSPSAERRQVSVLFLDLEGFTPLAESLDPEDVRELQSRYFESVRGTVARYGGSLEKFIGDAVMAVWGTPVAHEDDAERAVRAGLEILAAVSTTLTPSGAPLTARAAVATGEAAVALGARDEGMVSGDLVNTAARLQAIAPAGTVFIDAATRQVVGRSIATEAAGEHQLKGKSTPVAAWSASAVAADRRGTDPGHRGPFVGRDTELATMRGMLESVLADGRLRVVSLTGIAGIGKSRLAWELERIAGDSETPPAWHTARAPAYGEGVAFAPLAAIVRGLIGVSDSDATEVVHRALSSTLARLVPDPAERAWLEVRALALMEPESGEAYERDELFATWRRLLSAAAGLHPLVVVFEDLHWADAGLLDFIEYLADWSRHDPILVLTLGRPELLDARPTWGAGLQHFSAVHLDRLPDEAIDALLRALAPELAPETVLRVRQRADGVPLYAVEMARMLDEPGARAGAEPTADEIPRSLHALIAARIDALPPAERSLLLTAAVLGRRFRIETLQGVDDRNVASTVHGLVRREFLAIDEDPRSPGRGQIAFVQDLVREVAYGTLARAERRARHLRIVAFLESLGDADYTEPIAEHLLAAHRSAARSGTPHDEIATRAVAALRRAAERASALHAPQRAVAQLHDALTLTEDAGTRAELMEAAGAAARAAAQFDQAERYLRDAAAVRDEMGDTAASARARAQLAALLLQAQRSEPALAELEAAWADIAGLDDAGSMRDIPAQLARAHLLLGDAHEAVRWARQVIEPDGRPPAGDNADAIELDALVTLGTALVQSGHVGDGTAMLRSCAERAHAASLGSIELRARNNLAWLVANDDPRTTYQTARAGYELALRLGNREMMLQMLDGATVVAVDTGDWDWAVAAIDEAESGPLPAIYRLDLAVTRAQLAAIRGDADVSSRLDALDALTDLDSEFDEAALGAIHYARAFVTLTRGDLTAARDSAELAAAASVEYELPRALALSGRLAAWSGDHAAAREALAALEAVPGEGRALSASRSALRAAVDWASGRESGQQDALAAWDEAISSSRELGLPLREAFCLIDRARLLGDAGAASQAASLLANLGAGGLIGLVAVEPAPV